MIDFPRISDSAVVLPMNLTSELFSMVLSLMKACGDAYFQISLVAKIPVWPLAKKMLLEKPELLVLDEPTNHLDIETITWLENYLVNYQGALIIVSHDRYFLDKVATVTLDLTKHSLDRYVGNYSKFMDLKAEKLATEAKEFRKATKRKLLSWRTLLIVILFVPLQPNVLKARRKQLEKIERLDKPTEGQKSANMTFHVDKVSGNVVLTVRECCHWLR